VRKKAYDSVGGYDASLDCAEDWDMAIRLSLAGWKGKSILKPIHLCRVHTLNVPNIELRHKLRTQQLERKYWMMKPYLRVIWLFDNLVLVLKSPRSFKLKLYNKIVARIFHVPRLPFPPRNFQHVWVNEKATLKKVRGCRVLDCGCGCGRWGYLLRGKEVVGIDVSKPYLQEAKMYEHVVLGSASALPFQSGVFDTSLAIELIEHLLKAEGYSFLKDLKRVSAKRIVMTTPRDFEPIFYGSEHPETHKSYWTRQEILTILQQNRKQKILK
jgi:2-polyprenyl-3-methyl-5-hydroxy-6-metoxy-1,4-benzoquinol methylase